MERFEVLSDGYGVFTVPHHTFGADALRLADFVPHGLTRICEFGTGCGVIAVILAARDAAATVTALDLQPEATALAARAVTHNGLDDRITVLTADWRDAPLESASFDAVVCNPPYFPAALGKQSPDPSRRLARHEDSPLALEELCRAAARVLRHGGRFFLCHRPERLADLVTALRTAGLEPKRLRLVQHDATSAPYLLLCEARKGGKPGMTVEPTFVG